MRRIGFLSLALVSGFAVLFGLANTNARTRSVATGTPQREGSAHDQGLNLKGTCIWQELKIATTTGEQQGAGPATILASLNFDGSGRMTMDYDTNINGSYSSTNNVPGSYTLDPTGHGSFSFTSPASGYVRTYDFRMSPNGHTIYTMAQSDGVGTIAQRVSIGSCSLQQ